MKRTLQDLKRIGRGIAYLEFGTCNPFALRGAVLFFSQTNDSWRLDFSSDEMLVIRAFYESVLIKENKDFKIDEKSFEELYFTNKEIGYSGLNLNLLLIGKWLSKYL